MMKIDDILKRTLLVMLILCKALAGFSGSPAGEKKAVDSPVRMIPGYFKDISGEILPYHSCNPDANSALLIRCMNELDAIEWETALINQPVSNGKNHKKRASVEDTLTFLWIAGYSTGTSQADHTFHFYAEGEEILSFVTHKGSENESWLLRGRHGMSLEFQYASDDAVNDHFGYMLLKVPASYMQGKQSLRLKVKGDGSNSRDWYMTMRYVPVNKTRVKAEQAVIGRDGQQPLQRLKVSVDHYGALDSLTVWIDGKEYSRQELRFGLNEYIIPVTPVDSGVIRMLKLSGKTRIDSLSFTQKPVRDFTVFLLPHSHVDIGYTHLQAEVEEIQKENVVKAMKLVRKTRDYPDGARFRWNVEVMWALEAFLREAAPKQKEEFIQGVREGSIDLGALYANVMTGLCHPEELFHLFDYKNELEREWGFNLQTAMISDIPGQVWGLVPAMAQNGVRYFSSGPNAFDRIGHTLEAWGDKPFYWLSPSGKEKVLTWVAGSSYALFHKGTLSSDSGSRLLDHLAWLDTTSYPYDIVQMRYTIGGDNGGPDSLLPDFVKLWNESYLTPRLRIATASEMFRTFEVKYGKDLPLRTGDMSPYWEDGAASSARETAMNRETARRLVKAEKLWTLYDPRHFPHQLFKEAWKNVLLYSEHTWGAWNSISDPDLPFVTRQWEVKRSFALKADSLSKIIFNHAIRASMNDDKPGKGDGLCTVHNFSPQAVDHLIILNDLIKLTQGMSPADENVKPMLFQISKTDGRIMVLLKGVPANGFTNLKMKSAYPSMVSPFTRHNRRISNGILELSLDESSGDIRSLKSQKSREEWVDTTQGYGLDAYVHTGKQASGPVFSKKAKFETIEDGPLVYSLRISAEGSGARSIIREIIMYSDLNRIDIYNYIDKIPLREKENVRFCFPFRIKNAQVRFDYAWSTLRPEADQMQGGNRNYFTFGQGLKISNPSGEGLVLYSPDSPFGELGGMTSENWMKKEGQDWEARAANSSLFFSWVMNNSWHTNFRATQDGMHQFRYSLHFSDPGVDTTVNDGPFSFEPLVVAGTRHLNAEAGEIYQALGARGLEISLFRPDRQGHSFIIRMFNPFEENRQISFKTLIDNAYQVLICDAEGMNLKAVTEDLTLNKWDIINLKIFPPASGTAFRFPFLDPGLAREERISDLVSRMTFEEKIAQLQHAAPAIARLGVPAYNWWNECLHGVGRNGIATVFPQAIGLAATWDPELIYQMSEVVSTEARAKYRTAMEKGYSDNYEGLTFFSPNINLFRDPRWGRGQETFGEDTYLTSRMAVSFIKGLQGDDPRYYKTIATPKHFAVHSGPESTRHTFDVKPSKRDLYESYLPAFEACVTEAGAASVMVAYNRLYGEPCCKNDLLLKDILRGQWGFRGYVTTDCGAIWDMYHGHQYVSSEPLAAAMALRAGSDLSCGTEFFSLKDALDKGLISEKDVNNALGRLMEARFKLGMFDPPGLVKYNSIPKSCFNTAPHNKLAREVAQKSIVLLKNEKELLPLPKDMKAIAVIGPNAGDTEVLMGNYNGTPSNPVSVLMGIKNKVGKNTKVFYHPACSITGDYSEDSVKAVMDIVNKSDVVVMVMGISPRLEGEELQLKIDGFSGGDRTHINLPKGQQALIRRIQSTSKPIVLVILSGSALSITWEKDHIPAIIQLWYPGQQGGNALADVLFGDENPSGRLPVTFYQDVNDLPPFEDYSMKGRTYKYYKGETLFPFGHGLSYTHFDYVKMKVDNPLVEHGDSVHITLTIKNSGKRKGGEVIQLYIHRKESFYERPEKSLVAFKKVMIKQGDTSTVSLTISPWSLRIYDDKRGRYIIEPGKYLILAGSSSEDIRIKSEFEIIR